LNVILHFNVNLMMTIQRERGKKKKEENNFLIEASNIPCSPFYFSNEYAKKKRGNAMHMTFCILDCFIKNKKILFQRTITKKKSHEHILIYKHVIRDISL